MNSLLIAQNIIKRAIRSRKEFMLMHMLPVVAIGIMTFMPGTPSMQRSRLDW